MSEVMLLGVLRMPLTDNPAEISVMEWVQIRDRMREAADAIERLTRERDDWEATAMRISEINKKIVETGKTTACILNDRAEAAERKVEKLREAHGAPCSPPRRRTGNE